MKNNELMAIFVAANCIKWPHKNIVFSRRKNNHGENVRINGEVYMIVLESHGREISTVELAK